MVRLTKIYTKFGDQGRTMLGDGSTTTKHDLRVEAYGTVDEANAAIGVAVSRLTGPSEIRDELLRIQNDLFDVGADLCVPIEPGEAPGKKLRTVETQTQRLEAIIDRVNDPLGPLTSFILPGGTALAAELHLARTITRRAERCVSKLLEADPARTNTHAMVYLNRLSDLLFVLARSANVGAGGDVLWKPGHNR